jgi:hypothetical protein
MSAVTDRPKCYVFVCVGCNLLAMSERSDTLTCSTKCRVRAHRNGSLERLRVLARAWDITPALIVQSQAIRCLRPDVADMCRAGTLTIREAQALIWPTFWDLLSQPLEANE